MIHSMTAFARAEQAGGHGTLSWEIRSVNHRYLEPHLRLPDAFRDLEGAVRDALRKGLSRGKVECTLRFAEDASGRSMQVDSDRARQLIVAAENLAALIKQPAAINPLEVLSWPGVLVGDSADPQALNSAALQLFHDTLTELKTAVNARVKSWPDSSMNALMRSPRKPPRYARRSRRCSPHSARRFSNAVRTCASNWIRSASSRKW